MRIILQTRRVTGSGHVDRPGDIIDVPEREALALIRDQSATPAPPDGPETMTAPPQRETRKRGRPRNN